MNLDLDAVERQLYLDSFYHFAKYCLEYKDMVPHVHGRMARILEEPTPNKLLCVPRGTFKSSLASVAYPIWRVLKNPNIRIMIDSEVYTNSTNYLREIKGHLQNNQRFIRLFGDLAGPVWTESEIIVSTRTVNKKEPTIVASGIGAGKTGQHYDLIIGDDLSSPKNTMNQEQADKVVMHYRLYTSLLDPGGEKVIIGTRYSEIDIIGHIIQNELGIPNGDLKEFKNVYLRDRDQT